MNFLFFNELSPSRQKAIKALNSWRVRAERRMNDAQLDHGTQSPEYAAAAARFEAALDCYNSQVARTQMPDHPLYVSPESAAAYQAALPPLECAACGTALGLNPQDGKLGCPHIACCADVDLRASEVNNTSSPN